MNPWFDFEALARIGLGERQRRQLMAGVADADAQPMRVVEVQRDHWRLHDGRHLVRARCDSLLAAELRAQHEQLAVGDWVLARPAEVAAGPGLRDGAAAGPAGAAASAAAAVLDGPDRPARPEAGWRIACRLLPAGQIARRTTDGRAADGRAGWQRQVLASNVDLAVLVMGLDGDFNPRRLERHLALARLAGVAAVLLLSKADTLAADAVARRLTEARAALPADVPALALDLRDPAAAEALTQWLRPGCTAVLLGSSGAGKSTLANTLLAAAAAGARPGARRTGAVRADDSRGRHTTTVRTLLPLPGGACLIDTPGLRALRLDLDAPDQLAQAFGDVAALAPLCRFRDCRHGAEPGCAVREALSPQRLRNYQQLLREAGRDAARAPSVGAAGQAWSELQSRQAERAQRKARSRAARQRERFERTQATALPRRGATGP